MPKFRRCAIFRTRVIRQRVSLKIIVFSMEKPGWSPSEGHQHGGRKPVETSEANRYFRARNMLPRNNTDVTHREKTMFYFQNKAVYRAEDRPTD